MTTHGVGGHTTFVLDPTSFHSRSETPDSSCGFTKDIVASDDVRFDKAKSAIVDLVSTPLPDPPRHAVQLKVEVGATASEADSDNTSDDSPTGLRVGTTFRPGLDTTPSSSIASPPLGHSLSDGAEASTGGGQSIKATETVDPYSVKGYCLDGLSPLETVVPDELMPYELVVHDLFNLTRRHHYSPIKPTVPYRRAMPLTDGPTQLVRPATEPTERLSQHRVAHLYLPENRLGVGNHSTVFRAPFELKLDLTSGECARVTVTVKTAAADCVSHRMLHQEALMYTAFPRTFMEESPQGLSGAYIGVGHGQSQCSNVKGRRRRGPKILPAVVPKFYGYYLPLDDDGNIMWSTHRECGEESKPCLVDWPSGLLLVEECGKPIHPYQHTREERQKCFELFERLHEAGFSQGSPLERNILVQPGPLSEPRERRSLDRPSFRLIDFGRGETAPVSRKADVDGPRFAKCVGSDKTHARRALRLHA